MQLPLLKGYWPNGTPQIVGHPFGGRLLKLLLFILQGHFFKLGLTIIYYSQSPQFYPNKIEK
jgi:hypothetical protein